MLLAMGRFEPAKGFDMLIDAFAMVAPKHPSWKLCICGNGELYDTMQDRAALLGMKDRIQFPGFVHTTDYMSRASGFIMSSRFEGIPLVLLEALAHGLPIVTYELSSVLDVFEDGKGALIAPCNDVAALAEKMDLLMSANELRSELSKQSLEIAERYSVESIAQHWEKLFHQLMDQ